MQVKPLQVNHDSIKLACRLQTPQERPVSGVGATQRKLHVQTPLPLLLQVWGAPQFSGEWAAAPWATTSGGSWGPGFSASDGVWSAHCWGAVFFGQHRSAHFLRASAWGANWAFEGACGTRVCQTLSRPVWDARLGPVALPLHLPTR